jgi:hypothetical protein
MPVGSKIGVVRVSGLMRLKNRLHATIDTGEKLQRRQASLEIKKPCSKKKSRAVRPCSENCVDPFVSPKIGFDLD